MVGETRAFEAYLIFDFGEDRMAAQQGLATVEQWRKSFKLRDQLEARLRLAEEGARVAVHLAFEEFEKLAFERWLERIPREEVFAPAGVEVIRPGDERFRWAGEWFDAAESAFR